jgi:crossover junction endodeoxyribonuclease RuvC
MIRYYLAMDTSLTKSGWAVMLVSNGKATVEDYGLIKSDANLTDGERLRQIHGGITEVIERHRNIERVIPREAGIVRFNLPTKQIFKAHGVTEFALADFEIIDINISTVKAWARRITGSPGKRNDKAMIEEAVTAVYGDGITFNKGGDIADAIAVGTVYLLKEGVINE